MFSLNIGYFQWAPWSGRARSISRTLHRCRRLLLVRAFLLYCCLFLLIIIHKLIVYLFSTAILWRRKLKKCVSHIAQKWKERLKCNPKMFVILNKRLIHSSMLLALPHLQDALFNVSQPFPSHGGCTKTRHFLGGKGEYSKNWTRNLRFLDSCAWNISRNLAWQSNYCSPVFSHALLQAPFSSSSPWFSPCWVLLRPPLIRPRATRRRICNRGRVLVL